MNVRRARIEDAPAWLDVLRAVAREGRWIGTQVPFDERAREERFREGLRAGSAVGWLLEHDGRVAGMLDLEQADHNPGFATLGMAVLAEARGRGGGRALLHEALTWARASELRKLGLEVWTDNVRAIGLYASAGFVIEGIRRDHYQRGDGSLRSTMVMSIFV